ncbi:glycosyltransferase family 4 protein [Salmonella enterica]|uniref:Glycosyltransferase family 1 protein n=1 Tax=Salmonella enterica subsp. salamae serovar 50:b:z6 TaxID=1967621 RepID=A0A603BIA8_SALER|nr:glycosyltransferase family 4 protein [Salmonella enterica]EAB9864391.1 glycosyltransferase family 1 protein [Salmonella enterica subsp. salamae]EBQ4856077.1 glycosyltransferase family 4 protein [Salmonella enterica subsp. salamae]ECC1649419.1 glycosyltransferase family 4 protein [Salmonella enterica subsp. salamae]ECE6784116.1 glycosyltransferase family 1 protein [Salmonella enterica subsp. salamae]ECG0741710.1 glycosyltransferase family 1 protein [Salmonella enterica subsp. salamae]
MIKILHIHLSSEISGAQRVSLDEMKTLSKQFQQSMVCSKAGNFTAQANEVGVQTFVIRTLVRKISFYKDLKSFIELYRLIKKEKYDIIHTHSSKTGFLGRLAAKLAGTKKIVHTVHGFAFPSTKNKIFKAIYFLMEYIASLCTSVIIVMNKNDEIIARKYFCVNAKTKLILLNNAIDISRFDKLVTNGSSMNSKKRTKNKFKLVMVGRLCEQKNPLLVLEAIKKLNNDFSIDFIGDGPLKEEVQNKIIEYGIAERVKLLGWCVSVEDILYKYDLFVLPSKWEGMPLAILEAMAAKIPVLCSDIDANRYLLGKTSGFLFKSEDSDDFANKIKFLYENDEIRQAAVQEAYSLVVNDFDLCKRTKILESIYTHN